MEIIANGSPAELRAVMVSMQRAYRPVEEIRSNGNVIWPSPEVSSVLPVAVDTTVTVPNTSPPIKLRFVGALDPHEAIEYGYRGETYWVYQYSGHFIDPQGIPATGGTTTASSRAIPQTGRWNSLVSSWSFVPDEAATKLVLYGTLLYSKKLGTPSASKLPAIVNNPNVTKGDDPIAWTVDFYKLQDYEAKPFTVEIPLKNT